MAEIQLTQGKVAHIDDAARFVVAGHKWFAVRFGHVFYAAAKVAGRRVLMHRLLLGMTEGDSRVVDHIDGCGLNNRSSNLRRATATINQRNRRRNSNNGTGVSGLCFRAEHGPAGAWVATAMREGRLRTKTFGCLRRGPELARSLAEAWRKAHEFEYGIVVREGAPK